VLAGGSEACIVPIAIAGFSVMKAMAQNNDNPQGAARPFDLHREGFVVGEGATILVLESLEYAQARGAQILGELLGYGASADAYHISMPAEDGGGAILAMQAALDDAGVDMKRVSYINCHGTGTLLNDKTETLAIKTVFGEHAYDLAISSTKSMHGHLLGAAGALEAAVCLQSLQHNVLPPTINYEVPDPDCDLDVVPNTARESEIDLVMSNGFGLGGHNASIIFGRV
jgi:3-oxoacyl-[acyl-carrier-protein] synthase II